MLYKTTGSELLTFNEPQTSNFKLLYFLNGETFPAAASSCGVGIIKEKAFAIEAVRVIELCTIEIQEAFHLYRNPHAFIFKELVAGLFF